MFLEQRFCELINGDTVTVVVPVYVQLNDKEKNTVYSYQLYDYMFIYA